MTLIYCPKVTAEAKLQHNTGSNLEGRQHLGLILGPLKNQKKLWSAHPTNQLRNNGVCLSERHCAS